MEEKRVTELTELNKKNIAVLSKQIQDLRGRRQQIIDEANGIIKQINADLDRAANQLLQCQGALAVLEDVAKGAPKPRQENITPIESARVVKTKGDKKDGGIS